MSILVIAEKPSVAKDIARVLGADKKLKGCLYNDDYIISWAIGHLVGLSEPDDINPAYKKWTFSSLPIIPDEIKLKILPKTEDQFNILKKLMTSPKVSEIICATDSGREGELIFRYIYTLSGCNKPFKRLWISSMTNAAIKKGFSSLKDGHEYDNLYNSAKCRSEADWLVGMNASRAYSIKYNARLSIGRVQTPTLSLIVANKKEIEAFVPQTYWEVVAEFASDPPYKGTWFDSKSKDTKTIETKFYDEQKAKAIKAKLTGKQGTVADIVCEEKSKPHPLLHDLTELQRDCNKKFGFSAKKTLDIAQLLYEKHKVITYPRTDSRHLSSDMVSGIKKVIELLSCKYNEFTSYVLGLDTLPITKRIVDDSKITDHHAIIPTGKNFSGLNKEESLVFDLIARRLIAAFYPDYTYTITKITTTSEDEHFLSKGQTIKCLGWMAVLGKESDDGDVLPPVNIHDIYDIKGVKVVKKSTTPPKPYTEATLLSAMENAGRMMEDESLKEAIKDSGLGTPATRAATIERLINVGYVKREKKNLIATEKAVNLIEIVPKELKTPETTAKWERALTLISNGKMDTDKFNQSIKRYVCYIVEQSNNVNRSVIFAKESNRS